MLRLRDSHQSSQEWRRRRVSPRKAWMRMSMTSPITCQRFQDFLTQDQKLLHKTTEFLRSLTHLSTTTQSVPMPRDRTDHLQVMMVLLLTTVQDQRLSHHSRMSQSKLTTKLLIQLLWMIQLPTMEQARKLGQHSTTTRCKLITRTHQAQRMMHSQL